MQLASSMPTNTSWIHRAGTKATAISTGRAVTAMTVRRTEVVATKVAAKVVEVVAGKIAGAIVSARRSLRWSRRRPWRQ